MGSISGNCNTLKLYKMKLQEVNVKSILALFIIFFGMIAMVFVHMEDMVLGAIIGFMGAPLQYFFGSSKSSTEKDKTISDMSKSSQADAPDIGGGGIKNDPPKP